MADLSKLSEQQISFFTDILRQINETPYGEIAFSITTHRGNVTKLVSNEFVSHKYNTGDNHIAMAELLQGIKQSVDDKKTGTLTVTLVLQDGAIHEVINQYSDRKLYR